MKSLLQQIVFITLFFNILATYANNNQVGSVLKIRPQSLNGARKVSGEIPGENTHAYVQPPITWWNYDPFLLGDFPFDTTQIQSFISITPAYQKTFRADTIAHALFGNSVLKSECDNAIIKVQGSKVADRDPRAWLADYFYLPEQFDSTLFLSPSISNAIVDFNVYINFDGVLKNMYARIYAPFVHTKWDLGLQESISAGSNGSMSGGRFSPDTLYRENLLPNVSTFLAGVTPPVFTQPGVIGENTAAPYTIVRHSLTVNKINSSTNTCNSSANACNTLNGFGEIRGELGYDVWRSDYGHAGFYLAGAAPTGNSPHPAYLFSPVIGNGKHWELGGGVTGHWIFWTNEYENKQCGIYADAVVTHLFGAQQCRTFDLKNKPMSRYMLAAKHILLDPPGGANKLSGSSKKDELEFDCQSENDFTLSYVQVNGDEDEIPAPYQFANEFTPVANLTTREVKVSVNAQIDATLWFNYHANGLSIDAGYNLWLQTKDHIACPQTTQKLTQEAWALQGDAQLFGYFTRSVILNGIEYASSAAGSKAIAIAASQSHATINQGTNEAAAFIYNQTHDTPIDSATNSGVDNPLNAFAQTVPPNDNAPYIPLVNFAHRDMDIEGTEIFTKLAPENIQLSIPPVFIKESDIDFNSNVRAISHKVFGSIGYTLDFNHLSFYAGIGGEAEFGKSSPSSCVKTKTTESTCTPSINGAPSQWGVWVKFACVLN